MYRGRSQGDGKETKNVVRFKEAICGLKFDESKLLLLLLLLTANGFIPGGSVLQCKTGQYNTVQYNTIIHNTQGNPQYAKLQPTNQPTHKQHILYPIKTHKRSEPKESLNTLLFIRYY
jgi:hypothetical protein